ncbi:MAG: thioredoxin domain-containing protein, partial [Planctomycetes bacterium]|nr:thioredoxin domain-containing protein [Planctomycetota bacterium]
SGLALIVALVVGWRWPGSARAGLPALALLAAGLSALRLSEHWALWPCEALCAGGAHYQRIFTVPILPLALALQIAVAGSALRDRHRDHLSACTQALAWAALGATAYFLFVAWRLGVRCPHCFAVHTVVLCYLGALVREPTPWVDRVAMAALVGLALHAGFHPALVRDGINLDLPEVTSTTALTSEGKLAYAAADGSRRRGSSDAPLIVELAIDFQCRVCAEQHAHLIDALQPALSAGKVELVTRHVVRKSEPSGRRLARWAAAAAIVGEDQYQLYCATMLGSRPGADESALRVRLREALDPLSLDGIVDRHAAVVDRLVGDDLRRLRELQATAQTPQAILVARDDGRVLGRWEGAFDTTALVRAVE